MTNLETSNSGSVVTVSLLELLREPEHEEVSGNLEMMRIGEDASFLAFFTDQAAPVAAHYLEGTDTWAASYYQCPGEGCPACAAGIKRNSFLLIPVVDRIENRVKVLRVPHQKGPGKLLTEIAPALASPVRDKLTVKVTQKNFTYTVDIQANDTIDPEVATAAKRFVDQLDAGVVNIAGVMPLVTITELGTHEKIAKRLALGGRAQ